MSENSDSYSVRLRLTLMVPGTSNCSLIVYFVYRQFILNNYESVKEANPEFPFIVRECLNAQPTVMARYDWGVERRVYLNNLSEREIDQIVADLVSQSK